jgi:hypothetical protein
MHKSPQQHAPNQQPFTAIRDLSKVIGRTHKPESRSDIADTSSDSGKSRYEINTRAGEHYRRKTEQSHIQRQEPEYTSHNII